MPKSYRNLSKSQYCKGKRCLKAIWLYQHKKDVADQPSEFQKNIFNQGTQVGILATQYFPDGVEIREDYTQPEKALEKTNEVIKQDPQAIFEGAFLYDEVLVRVDILRNNRDGSWDLIEVKSTNSVEPKAHYDDVAIQKWVLENAGIKIRHSFLMHLNRDYVRSGDLELEKLFVLENLDEKIQSHLEEIPYRLKTIKANLQLDTEPDELIGARCHNPYVCEFKTYCWHESVCGSIHRLGRINDKKRHALMDQGIQFLKDIPENFDLSTNQQIEVKAARQSETCVDLPNVRSHLDNLQYPLYFLDFESVAYAIPQFDGSWPHRHLTTQYSLHVQKTPESSLEHYEYLHDENSDPSEALALSLIGHILDDSGSVIVYHQTYERERICELIQAVPIFAERLEGLLIRMWDLEVPFSKRWYWDPAFDGSSSIKKVLPAFAPQFSYQDLGIQKGDVAQQKYGEMIVLEKGRPEREMIRQNLLEYCERDTLAMAVILSELVKVIDMSHLKIAI